VEVAKAVETVPLVASIDAPAFGAEQDRLGCRLYGGSAKVMSTDLSGNPPSRRNAVALDDRRQFADLTAARGRARAPFSVTERSCSSGLTPLFRAVSQPGLAVKARRCGPAAWSAQAEQRNPGRPDHNMLRSDKGRARPPAVV
jgi:hypothetical protein